MTKGADEAVQDFIAKVRQAAADVNLPEEQIKFVIINGLRSALRAHAIRSNPADLQALIDATVLAEQSEIVVPNASVIDGIARLEKQLQDMQISVVRQRDTISPRREHYDRYRTPSQSPNRRPTTRDYRTSDFNRQSGRYDRSPTPPRGNFRGRGPQRRVNFAAGTRFPSRERQIYGNNCPNCARRH